MFASTSGEDILAFFAAPDGRSLAEAILYIHAHGDRYDISAREVLDGGPALQGPLGQTLVVMGFAVLCIDLPGFGAHADQNRKRSGQGCALAG